MAGFVPTIPAREARPRQPSEIAGTSPAMTYQYA